MNINYKTYRIWRVLLDSPNEWLSVMDVAHDVNMTSRQVSSIVNTISSPNIIKERDANNKELYITIQGTPEEILQIKTQVMYDYYGISPNMCGQVKNTLSPIGWMTVGDISDDTGIERLNVSRILSILPNVVSKGSGSVTMYRLKGVI